MNTTELKALTFTPGPWRVEPDNKHENAIMAGQLFVAQTYGINPDSTANARLIAAAPELLEAVKGASVQRDPRHRVSMLVNDWERIEAAVAKAEGRGTPSAS